MELNDQIISKFTSAEYNKYRKEIKQYYIQKYREHHPTGNIEYISNKYLTKKEIKKKEYNLIKKNKPWLLHLKSIRDRCNNKNSKDYKNYGGRGIQCQLSVDDIKFLWFKDSAYLLNQPSIDRINNNGDYSLDNCSFIELIDNIKKGSKLLLTCDKNYITIFKYRTIFLKIYEIDSKTYYVIQTKNKEHIFTSHNKLVNFLNKKKWYFNYFNPYP